MKAKSPPSIPQNKSDAEALLGEMATALAEIKKRQAQVDLIITTARTEAQPEIDKLKAEYAAGESALEAWATANREELFPEKKSTELMNATFGFRWTPFSLALLSKQTWKLVLARLTDAKKKEYIRVKADVDKDQILKDATGAEPVLKKADLSELGLKLEREEKFFVEINATPANS